MGATNGNVEGVAVNATPFQSSPTPKGGRYELEVSIDMEGFQRSTPNNRHRCLVFQSSPTPKGGRYGLWRAMQAVIQVSILAHPGWALRSIVNPELFQSSPTPKGGRYAVAAVYC